MVLLTKPAVPLTALLAGVCLIVALDMAPAESSKKDTPPASPVFDKDPHHRWNRIHAAMFVRTGPDGKRYGDDRLEPLLWGDSQYLLKGEQADRSIAALEEFIRGNEETLIADPVKRAILQRDLWLVANWLIGRGDRDGQKLLGLLAQAIRRLALTGDQITKLPDNYAAAVASKKFAVAFDPEKPQRAYLPPNPFDPNGPWISVGRTDGRTAPAHLGGSHHITRDGNKNPFTNSTFLVFLKLPAGREAGLAFVKQLARQPKPIFVFTQGEDGRFTSAPNRDLPVLPIGSEMALIRRAMLIDTTGRIVPSPLTENVQLRVTTSTKVPNSDGGGLAEDPKRAAAFEFEMRRADLFGKAPVGLQDVSAEPDFITGFRNSTHDAFEAERRPMLDLPFTAPTIARRQTCFDCHAVSTLYGTRSFQRAWTYDEKLNEKSPPMFPIAAMEVQAVEKTAVKWKEAHPGWAALRKLLPE